MSERIPIPGAFREVSLCALNVSEHESLLKALDETEYVRAIRMRPGILTPREAGEKVPWAKDAFYVPMDTTLGTSVLHTVGGFYMQEASAMAAVAALDVQPGQKALDLCAAPGGKSTQIAGLLGGKGVLVSNEIVPSRAKILAQNLERMGASNAVVTNESPERLVEMWKGEAFDRVLVDAPCSGEGMFRREPLGRTEWSPEGVEGCAVRQRKILASAAEMVAPGGLLVYSTCTFNTVENEENVLWFLKHCPEFKTEDFALEGIGSSENGCLRLWPHRLRGEGHFVARLRRIGEETEKEKEVRKKLVLPEFFQENLPGFVPEGSLLPMGEHLWLLPDGAPKLTGIRTLRCGLALGEQRGKNFIPDHDLVTCLPQKAFARTIAVDEKQARRLLRGETLNVSETVKGWTGVFYRGLGLCWGKASEGILKNHLPKGLRKM